MICTRIVTAGIALLIALPVLRVFLMLVVFLRERDFLGAEGIVGKPFDVEALLVKVVELLGVGGQRPPTVTS